MKHLPSQILLFTNFPQKDKKEVTTRSAVLLLPPTIRNVPSKKKILVNWHVSNRTFLLLLPFTFQLLIIIITIIIITTLPLFITMSIIIIIIIINKSFNQIIH